jgi:PAS domain S-box-containing protein
VTQPRPPSNSTAPELLLDAIRRVTSRAALGGTAAEIAGVVAEEIVGLLSSDASAVFRIDGDEIVALGGGAAPGHRIFTVGARFPLERQMLAARIRETGEPARSDHYAEDPSDAARRVTALGYDVVVGAPILVKGALWGVIYAAANGPERLPAGSEHELTMFTELCAVAVASADHQARLESQAGEQEALMRVARTVLGGTEGSEAPAVIAREAASMLGASAAALLRDEPGGGWQVEATWPESGATVVGAADLELAAAVRDSRRLERIGDTDQTALPDRPVLGLPVGWAAPIAIGSGSFCVLLVAGPQGMVLPPDAAERVGRFAELSGLALASLEARRDLLAQLLETERFAALVELSDDFIALADLQGRTLYLNAGGRRLVGLDSLEEAIGRTILEYLTDDGREHFLAVSGPVTRREGLFRGETTLRHFKTGERIPVEVSSYTIVHPETGRPLATAVVQHDLRERKHAEEQLREHAERVEQLATARRVLLVEALESEDRMRRQLGDALHDEVLQELYAAKLDLGNAPQDEEAVPRARVAVDAATRQLRAAVSELHPAVSWSRDLESRLRAILEQAGERGGVAHRLECSAEATGRTSDLLIGLMRELVQNVVKHAQATFVTATVASEGDGIRIEVRDDGRGMPPGRPAEALRAGHVGLASARERVEALGGHFTVESDAQNGTRVTALVPRLA